MNPCTRRARTTWLTPISAIIALLALLFQVPVFAKKAEYWTYTSGASKRSAVIARTAQELKEKLHAAGVSQKDLEKKAPAVGWDKGKIALILCHPRRSAFSGST